MTQAFDVDGVDHQNLVAPSQAAQCGGGALLRSGDIDGAVALHYVGAYAAVFAGVDVAELLLLLAREIFGVRVKLVEHCIDAGAHGGLHVDGVDIV